MKQYAPAADRNRGPILAAIRDVLPAAGLVLEIASGTGQHATFFAAALPGLTFVPSDVDPVNLESIRAHVAEAKLANLRPPLRIDVTDQDWAIAGADAVICSNMLHIAPWAATLGLFRGAGRLLPAGAPLVTYGPYRFAGAFTAPSNAAFDASLRARDPRWGVRDVADVERVAVEQGFSLEQTIEMPANNHLLVFRRGPRPG